jgi:poly(hydroxyalkanoate) depolymerase family esterase
MKLNEKLLVQMRAATRAMFGKGASDATTTIMEETLKNASVVQQAMRDLNLATLSQPASNQPASNQPAYDPGRFAEQFVPELLAKLGVSESGKLPGMSPVLVPEAEDLPGTFSDHSYTNAAGTRNYKLYVPSTYRDGVAAPLVVMLHGCSQGPVDFALGTQMNLLAEESGCLVVYPEQSQQANVTRCWNWFKAVDQQRDQGEPSIIAGITRDVMDQHAVVPGQVYVAGLSAGGAMAIIMGTLYPELYAAVGVHSGLPYASAHDLPSALAAMQGDIQRRQSHDHTVPIIVFHGDRDTTVHPSNGEELVAHARDVSKEVAVEPGRVPDGYAYTRTTHQRDDGRVHAEHWLIHGAGHAWSGGSARGSYTDGKGPDASREMMRFFRTHQ